ncbi:hypothetical protein COCNU_09G000320 [Cocos nucifera]|uniref:Uncharacterized protein n=1 Tax=Cocos nucifera TaxID=13894 RepID=A0A8K0IJL0_COCNU|nr:hypothetical protein COCNU_09G000320 [Cocos nucifera]
MEEAKQATEDKAKLVEYIAREEKMKAKLLLEERLKASKAWARAMEEAKQATEDKAKLVEYIAREEKMKVIAEAKLKGIKEYKALAKFESEDAKASLVAYPYGFHASKARLHRMAPKLDLSHLHVENSEDEVGAFSLNEDESILPKPTPIEALIPTVESIPYSCF